MKMKTEAKTEKLSLEVHPGYAAALARLDGLRADFHKVDTERLRLEVAVGELGHENSDDFALEVAQLLSDTSASDAAALRKELDQARRLCLVFGRAVVMQEKLLSTHHTAASVVLCKMVEPSYRAAVQELARAIIALGVAAEAEVAVRRQISETGADWCLPMFGFQLAGKPSLTESATASWLRAAVVAGFVEKNSIPAAWLAVWGCYLDAELGKPDASTAPLRGNPRKPDGDSIAYTM